MENGRQQTTAASPKRRVTSFIVLLIGACGLIVRLVALSSAPLQQWLESRVEVSTPLTAWSRVLEGVRLRQQHSNSGDDNISDGSGSGSGAYAGDLVHELPLLLRLYELLLLLVGNSSLGVRLLFVGVDLAHAALLYTLAGRMVRCLALLERAHVRTRKYKYRIEAHSTEGRVAVAIADDKKAGGGSEDDYAAVGHWSPLCVLVFYLFNPFTVASCVGLSTSSLVHSVLLTLWLHALLAGHRLTALLTLALHAHASVYSAALVVPSISWLLCQRYDLTASKTAHSTSRVAYAVHCAALFAIALLGIGALNLYLEAFDARFVECTYLFVLRVPELMPNMGLFWYFLTEMFDHFLLFFTFVFQLNAFVYAVPLTARLHTTNPVLALVLQCGLLAVLKSYPCAGDTGYYLCLLVPFAYLGAHMRNVLVYSCMLLVASVLAPVMFYLWLGSGGGNANFYFAITLVFAIGQIFLLVDVLYAQLKREFILRNGVHIPTVAASSDKEVSGGDSLALFSLQ